MRTRLAELSRLTAGYSLAAVAGPLLTLLLTPLYTRVLTTSDYGTVDTLVMLGTVLYTLGLLGLNTVIQTLYFDPTHAARQPEVLASTLAVALLWSGVVGVVAALSAEPLTRLTLNRTDVVPLVQLSALSMPFGVMYTLQAVVLRLHFAVRRANLLALLYVLVWAAANLLFVVALGWGSAGVIWAYAALNSVMGLAGLLCAPYSLRARPHPALMRTAARLGLPLVPATLAVWLLVYQDRLFLVRYVPLGEIGLYALAVRLAGLLAVLVEAFKSAWTPLALAIQAEVDAPRTYNKLLTYVTAGGLWLGLALSLFGHEALLLLATPTYLGAARYLWLLVLTPISSAALAVVSIGLLISQRPGQLAWATAGAALLNTLLNLLLIPPYGVLGASVATAAAYLVNVALAAWAAQRVRPFPYEWRRVLIALALYLLLAGAAALSEPRAEPLSLLLRGLLLLAYPLLLWLCGVCDTSEVHQVLAIVRQPRQLVRQLLTRNKPMR